MALTYTTDRANDVFGNLKVSVVDVALDNNYTVGGYVVTAQNLGLTGVAFGFLAPKTVITTTGPGDGLVIPTNNGAGALIKLQAPSGTAEVAANAALTGAVITLYVFGW